MISASKTTFSHYNLKILRPEVTKKIKNFRKKFCEFRTWLRVLLLWQLLTLKKKRGKGKKWGKKRITREREKGGKSLEGEKEKGKRNRER